MALTRIFSDLHFGDRASRVHRLAQLRPLLEGVGHLVLNGDTLDTRPGPFPAHTAECRAAVLDFFPGEVAGVTFLTGNHDADFSPHHRLDLAAEEVFVTHGDIFFDDIVPWGIDAPLIRRMIAAELARGTPRSLHDDLDERLALFRRVAAAIPQRHQSEPHGLKYVLGYITDTLWPPWRVLQILRAWRLAPVRAAQLAARHRPTAKYLIAGHTHRAGIWSTPGGVTVINTGSFCPPLAGCCVDLDENSLTVRRIELLKGEFRVGAVLATFPL